MARSISAGARALRTLSRNAGALELAEGLADVWADYSQDHVPVDTGQTQARTQVSYVSGSGVRGEAEIVSDTPYAGRIEYGTRFMPPRPYFRGGRDEAARVAGTLGGQMGSQIARALSSGGVWNPRDLF